MKRKAQFVSLGWFSVSVWCWSRSLCSLLARPHSLRRGEFSSTFSLSFGTLLKRQNTSIKHCWAHRYLLCQSANRIVKDIGVWGQLFTSAAVGLEQGNTRRDKPPENGTEVEMLCFLMGYFFCLMSLEHIFSSIALETKHILTPINAKLPWAAAAHSKFRCCVMSPPTVGP